MGVFLSQAYFHRPDFGLPHTRGGVSTILLQWLEAQTVFPTHVGVFLKERLGADNGERLPHTRGGVSHAQAWEIAVARSSPHTWGCFCLADKNGGVPFGLPHTRGGVSNWTSGLFTTRPSSPHTWGCFHPKRGLALHHVVFPTHVGVFLTPCPSKQGGQGLPHTRGGVSMAVSETFADALSSPHTWGCFQPCHQLQSRFRVFPTHVGVFHRQACGTAPRSGLPHTRGGVSNLQTAYAAGR